jgi:CheY-like chemotaxis protein
MKDLAREVRIKALTGMRPLMHQKQIRLNETRRPCEGLDGCPGSSHSTGWETARTTRRSGLSPCVPSGAICAGLEAHFSSLRAGALCSNLCQSSLGTPMLPKTLAIIDDDVEYTEFLSQHLRELGVEVTVFSNSSDLLVDDRAYGFEFYVVDLMLPGISGLDLIDVIRRRSSVGLLVVSGNLGPQVFRQVVSAGADMYLSKPVLF